MMPNFLESTPVAATLNAKDIFAGYSQRIVLQGVSLELNPGSILALVGANGSGKSTLLRVLAGMHSPSAGKVFYGEQDLNVMPSGKRAQVAAYVPSELTSDFPLRVHEAVAMGMLARRPGAWQAAWSGSDREQVDKALETLACTGLHDRVLGTLSGGERQLVALARALVQDARIFLLDESLGKMDLHHQARVAQVLKSLASRGRSVAIVSHDLQVAADLADQVALLCRGQILAQGTPGEIFTVAHLEQVFAGANLTDQRRPGGIWVPRPRM